MRAAGRTAVLRSLAAAAILLNAVPAAYSFDLEEAIELLQDRALVIEIVARVTENGHETVWNMELTELTISGRAVQVELEGGGLVLNVQFTPYQDGDRLILVAQGQTWLGSSETEEVTYRSAYESIPISLGEPVLFFPLGTAPSGERSEDILNVELEIKVEPYQPRAEQ